VKKKVLLSLFLCLFVAPLLSAQTLASPNVVQCLPTNPQFATATPGVTAPCTPTPTPTPIPPPPTPTPVDGVIGPKFIILTVTYAPPGSASSVTYSNSTMLGTSNSVSNSFTNDVSLNASISSGFSIFGFGVNFTSTASTDLQQESDSSSSIAVNETTTSSTQIRGPSSSALGVDHDEDIVWVWLNPVIHFVANSSTSFTWTGFGFDLNDPTGNTDILGIPVKYLNGHAAMPANIADVLARRWAPPINCTSADPNCGTNGTEAPGLTAADLAAILAADPFANPSYVVNVPNGGSCTVDGRFCRTTNANLQYSPPPPGGQPTTQAFSMVHQTTATQGQGASSTYKVGFSSQFSAKAGFFADISAKLTTADTLTWVSKWSSLNTQQVGQTAALSVTGPTVADNYTGPVEFEVFQDNIYGTFMFGFVPEPTFTLSAGAASQNAVQGGVCSNYTVSIAALISGFASTVNLGVTGLPANATATFTPTSVTGAGSSTLNVCAPSTSTPVGTSTLTINATSGIEIHSTAVSFTVVAPPPPPPPPNFTISASPTAQSVTRGLSAGYTISTAAVSGFTGTETLTLGSIPLGLTAHLSAASIATGGSTLLTVTSSSTMAAGTYFITVTGTSGTLTHSVTVSLTVTAPPTGGCPVPQVVGASPNVVQCLPTNPV
jgi:hypothetical protein